jgi:neurotransmitter:Na+ symporter, NSS family
VRNRSASTPAHVAREQWSSRLAFVLAATGSAVGLGSIWKFPYITGMNGGGWFVLIYLFCIAAIAVPIMMAEILLGRAAARAPVGAFRALSRPASPWLGVAWLAVGAAFIILSYYSVVAGWTLHYAWLAASNSFAHQDAAAIAAIFAEVHADPRINLFWYVVFMLLTLGAVLGGVTQGIERWNRILMPFLFFIIAVLLLRAMALDGFARALDFVFGAHAEKLTPRGVLEALGHSFFTLSIGVGCMITYGSYLKGDDDIAATSFIVSALDTLISLMACLVVFPIIFSYGLKPEAGPGLVFVTLPLAFSQMSGGVLWGLMFFLLLAAAALASAISLLEVLVAHLVDERDWSRVRAAWVSWGAVLVFGVPAALSGSTQLFGETTKQLTSNVLGPGHGKNWFDFFDYLASNILLPLCSLGIALFVAWRIGDPARRQALLTGSRFAKLYGWWLAVLRYVVPVGIGLVFLHAIEIL